MLKNCFHSDMIPIHEIQLMKALSACAGEYYDFNVTRNVIIGTPVQILDGVMHNIHEAVGLPAHCSYTTVVEFWGKKLPPKERKAFFDFFSIDHLLDCFRNGQRHIVHKYWTRNIFGDPMLAEQNILLYEDVTNGDVLGLTYTRDLQPMDTLLYQSQHDTLTGLYNREGFFVRVQEMVQAKPGQLYIVRVNIRNFKLLNELRGTEQCDRLLQSIGRRLNEKSRESGFVAGRFTADHFYLCIQQEEFERFEIYKRIPVPWLKMDITINYGVYPVEDGIPVNVMCDRASMALSANGRRVLENICYYNDSFHQQLLQEQEIENEMEQALAEGQFCIYIQPKFHVSTDQIIGGESLVRWRHPRKGMIPPGTFISVFEKNGFILALDYYVWEESCRFLAEAKASGRPYVPLSVNVSRLHFYSGELQDRLTYLLDKYQLEAKDLELEITENLYAEDPESILSQCGRLQELGFKIAMDDFGSGFSSLNMLRHLPLDIIKMDLRFLTDDSEGEEAVKGRDILRTQIGLAHTIGLDVVVEGLETGAQRDFIREIGNCAAQGYYYARPMSVMDFTELLQSANGAPARQPVSGMASALRRERLRREQLQPQLELISVAENLFGYLLPEKEAVLSPQLARDLRCSQRVPNLTEHLITSGILSAASVSSCRKLKEAAERGERYGSAMVEYVDMQGNVRPYWLRFDTILDFEGNPLIAMFSVADFGDISEEVELLMASRQAQAEVENHKLKEQMEESQRIFQIVSEHSNRILYVYDLATRTTRPWDRENAKKDVLSHLYPEPYSEAQMEANAAIFPDRRNEVKKFFSDIHDGVPSGEMNIRVKRIDGQAGWYHFQYSSIFHNGLPVSAVISVEDITERHEHEMAYLRIRQNIERNEAGNFINIELDLTDDRLERMSGFNLVKCDPEMHYSISSLGLEILSQSFSFTDEAMARTYFTRDNFLSMYDRGVRNEDMDWQVQYPDGSSHWMNLNITLMEDPYNRHVKMFLWMRDITEEKLEQLEIRDRSERDGMTGVYNRATTEQLIRKKLEYKGSHGVFAILDLDRLKQINDGYGHGEGDNAIISVARILQNSLQKEDIIGRIGGDEFVFYMPDAAQNKEEVAGILTGLMRQIGTLSIGEHGEMGVSCSVGCVLEGDGSTYESLYQKADKALYHVKKSGRNNFAFYTPEMENDAFVYQMDKMFSLDQAKRSESSDVQHLLTALSEYYHLVLCCNITENRYHLMQEVKDGIFSMVPTFGKMDNMVTMSMMRMTPEDAQRFDNAVSRHALLKAGERGEKHVTIYFDFQDFDGKYYPAECTSILYRNEKQDLCEFALIRWRV